MQGTQAVVEKDLIFSLSLFPAIDGALLRHPLYTTPKAARRELYKEPAVHINVNYHLPSVQCNSKVYRVCPGLTFVWKSRCDVCDVCGVVSCRWPLWIWLQGIQINTKIHLPPNDELSPLKRWIWRNILCLKIKILHMWEIWIVCFGRFRDIWLSFPPDVIQPLLDGGVCDNTKPHPPPPKEI